MNVAKILKRNPKCSVCYGLGKQETRFSRAKLIKSAKKCQICSLIFTTVDWIMDQGGQSKSDVRGYTVLVNNTGRPLLIFVNYYDGTSSRYEIYTPKGKRSPWPQLGKATDLREIIDIDSAVFQMQRWIEGCLKNHSRCKKTRKSYLPTRVVDIGFSDADKVCLYESKPSDTTSFKPYVALSYCWGTEGNLTTTDKNLDAHKKQIDWGNIPATMQDAIQLTRRLRVRYIWIDALCIIQDNAEDWDQEAVKMAEYYEGAYLVLSATRSASAKHGMFGPRMPVKGKRGELIPVTFATGRFTLTSGLLNNKTYPVHIRETLPHHVSSSFDCDIPDPAVNPLAFRGWAFQERLLATRVVHITAQGMMWECKERAWCECGAEVDMKAVQKFNDTITSDHNFDSTWRDLIWEYSRKSLTFVQDKLIAFDGIASRFKGLKLGRYVFGYWETSLIRDMCWYARPDMLTPPDKNKNIILGPSWSWISTHNPVEFVTQGGVSNFAKVRKLPNVCLTSDLRAMIVYPPCSADLWHLTLETKAIDVKVVLCEETGTSGKYLLQPLQNDHRAIDPRIEFFTDVPPTSTGIRQDWALTRWKRVDEGDIFKCILLASGNGVSAQWTALVARPSDDDPTIFIRVGLVTKMYAPKYLVDGHWTWTNEAWGMVERRIITLL